MTEFDKHSRCIGGVVSTCKVCRKQYQLHNRDRDNVKRRLNYAKNPFKILARNIAYSASRKQQISDYARQYAKANREVLKEYHREYSVQWRNKNRGLVNAKAAEYRAAKLRQTPKWLTEEQKKTIIMIYQNCPAGYEVDHIIPLRHQEVKGLHVPWNLQYLKMQDNRSKGNRMKSIPKSDSQVPVA